MSAHTYLPTYIHTFIPTYIHTYIGANMHTSYVHTCMHAQTQTISCLLLRTLLRWQMEAAQEVPHRLPGSTWAGTLHCLATAQQYLGLNLAP